MVAIETQEYNNIIFECFATDKDLIEKWHIASGSGLQNCVDNTAKVLKELDVVVYKLVEDDKLVGYFGVEAGQHLTGFFIKPEFRNEKVIKKFWNLVDSKFEDNYSVGIYKKNEPAMKFLSKKTSFRLENENSVHFVVVKGV